MTYTINPNAKNVWIRDNEDTMDLSPITDASSVYLENGRTIEQELGEGSMVSNIATVDNSMSKIIDGTLDGAYESCLLKGRTLVNVLGSCKFSLAKTEEGKSVTRFLPLNPLIKPNTKYLYVINVLKNTLTRSDNGSVMKYCNTDSSKVSSSTCWGWMNHIYPGFTGVKKHIMTTRPVFEGVCELADRIEIYGSTDVGGVIEYQEGMENWDIPYFEGLCDVKMPILRNVGKNLFDINMTNFTNVTAIPIDGSLIIKKNTNPHYYSRTPIHLKPNTKYTFKCNTYRESDTETYVRLYLGARPHNDNLEYGGYVVPVGDGTFSKTFTTNSLGELYINGYTTTKGILLSNIQLEESSTATSYEDHKTNILHTSEEIVLRSLPNGVCDTYNIITSEYVKRIGEVVLDGSEVYAIGSNTNEEYLEFICQVQSPKRASSLCDKLITTIGHVVNTEYIRVTEAGVVGHILKSRLSAPNIDGLKEWLSSNNLTVQYELATPIVTTVNPIGVPFAYENGHVILESGYEGQSLLPTLEYSTVVNKTGQVQSVAKTIMKQEEQLSSLEKMLVQSIIEMDYNNTLLTLNLEIDEVM